MNPDIFFKSACTIAAIGWIIILFISPFWLAYDKFVVGIVIALLALTYTWINFSNFDVTIFKKFSTLDGISGLFQNRYLLTAAWTHFLAFDLFMAVWIKNNSVKYGINHLLIIPVLFFTCMLGPIGFVIYLLIRLIKTKKYFAENFISDIRFF